MDRVDLLYDKLRNKIPFCFLKLNDGECLAMENKPEQVIISRGDQTGSPELRSKLIEALNYTASNYYIGIPCSLCYNGHKNIAKNNIYQEGRDIDNEDHFLNANILINSNVNRTITILKETLTNKNAYVVVVLNKYMAANINKLESFGIMVSKVIEVSDKNAFDIDYERIKDEWSTIPNNAYILTLCGPLGRVISYEWFKQNNTLTCLELGSLFDPLLKNRSYSYHQNTLPLCEECNPTKLDKIAFSEYITDYTILQTECFYFDNIQGYYDFYKRDIDQIRNALYFRFMHELQNPLYLQWLNELTIIEEDIKNPLKKAICNFKKHSKSGMMNELNQLYYCRDLQKLAILSEIYLEYFKHLNDNDVKQAMFHYAFSSYDVDRNKAVQIFEELYKNKELDDSTRFYTKCNLDLSYPKIQTPIPKIIHLIYFKERDLCSYHWRCIKSILKYMPEYKVIIHNDIEPIDNECWNNIKNSSNIEIVKRERPIQFDGLDIHYVQYQADISRLEILYEYGGVYMDLDVLVIKNFEELFDDNKDFYISKEGPGENSGLINSFLAAKPGNEFLKIWLDNFKTGLRMDSWAYHIRDTNKQLLENNPHYLIKYNIQIMDNYHFFPVPWTDNDAFENRKEVIFNEKTYGIHLFDTILHNVLIKNEFFQQYMF